MRSLLLVGLVAFCIGSSYAIGSASSSSSNQGFSFHKLHIETAKARNIFITSVGSLVKKYSFDGVDLAWQFPPVTKKPGAKKAPGYGDFKDTKADAHRKGFADLVRDLKTHLISIHKALTISVLPHVSAKTYYNVPLLLPNIDAVHLMAFDRRTPVRNPTEADYTAPIYSRGTDDYSIDSAVRYWLHDGTPK